MRIYIELLLTMLFWGGTFVAGKLAAQNVGPFSIAFLRFTIASAFLLPLTRKREGRFPVINGSQFILIVLLGLTGISYLGVFGTVIGFVWYYQGVDRLGPTRAGLFINFVPIFGVLCARLFLKEQITLSLAAGAALVISGAYLTNRPSRVRPR